MCDDDDDDDDCTYRNIHQVNADNKRQKTCDLREMESIFTKGEYYLMAVIHLRHYKEQGLSLPSSVKRDIPNGVYDQVVYILFIRPSSYRLDHSFEKGVQPVQRNS